MPPGEFTAASTRKLIELYEKGYAATFGRTIPGLDVEIMNWTLRLAAEQPRRAEASQRSLPTSRQKRAAAGWSTIRPIRT